jgi:hypothetical protein
MYDAVCNVLDLRIDPYQQQYPFCDMTNVDAIMRNLFDGFIPQQDSYSIPPDLYTT